MGRRREEGGGSPPIKHRHMLSIVFSLKNLILINFLFDD